MNSEKVKEIIEKQCYDVLYLKDQYEQLVKTVQTSAIKLDTESQFYVGYIVTKSEEMKVVYDEYLSTKFNLRQIVHALGDEYVEMMDNILKGE